MTDDLQRANDIINIVQQQRDQIQNGFVLATAGAIALEREVSRLKLENSKLKEEIEMLTISKSDIGE